jgi:uncharacterized protein YbaR (Trm112 family)
VRGLSSPREKHPTAKILRVDRKLDVWWDGREIYCDRCGCSYVLERTDEVKAHSVAAEYCFQVACPNCRTPVVFMKPDWL